MSYSHMTHLEQKRFSGLSQRTSNALEMTEKDKSRSYGIDFGSRIRACYFRLIKRSEHYRFILSLRTAGEWVLHIFCRRFYRA